MKKIIIYAAAIVIAIVAACSVLKTEDSEKEIRNFILSFQNSLTKSDEEILKQFEAKQSKEAILSAIRILQNKENEFINCTPAYDDAKITKDEAGIKIEIPAVLKSVNLEKDAREYNETTSLTFWIEAKDKSFSIVKMEGEALYKSFAVIRNDMTYFVERELALKERKPIYELARALEPKFDSVIWYVTYKGKKYFYVVSGTWEYDDRTDKAKTTDVKMGLVDEAANIVIPIEYNLVGTLGFDLPMIVEVKKNNKVGYFNIDTRQLIVDTAYDMLIPYDKEDAFAIVKQDSVYGWLDKSFQYHADFPSNNARQWVERFYFIQGSIALKQGSQTFCEIPNEDNAGRGIVMPPMYLVKTGIFSEFEDGISTTSAPLNGWTEYKETKGSWIESVSDQISALVTTIKERYLEGREEFYQSNRLVFMDARQDTLAVTNIPYDKNMKIRKVADDLIEVKTADPYYFEDGIASVTNLPLYYYYKLSDKNISALKSNRTFVPSSFVKLDSTYLKGEFYLWKEGSEDKTLNFLPPDALKYIRNEILASYGYIFPDEETKNEFQFSWYNPRYEKIEDFTDQLTEIDKYNLAFLDKMIKLSGQKEPSGTNM